MLRFTLYKPKMMKGDKHMLTQCPQAQVTQVPRLPHNVGLADLQVKMGKPNWDDEHGPHMPPNHFHGMLENSPKLVR